MDADELLVACLCAAWCDTCAAYRKVLSSVAAGRSGTRFAWIDIEDDADALGDAALEIENFPTLLLLRGGQPLFYGPLLPHAATLARLLDTAPSGPLHATAVPPALADAVRRLAPIRPLAPQ